MFWWVTDKSPVVYCTIETVNQSARLESNSHLLKLKEKQVRNMKKDLQKKMNYAWNLLYITWIGVDPDVLC